MIEARVPLDDFTDQMLLDGLLANDSTVLAEVYRRHRAPMHRVAAAVGGSADAGDVVQDVMLRLWASPDGFVPARGSLRGFLTMRTRSRSIDMARSRTSRQARHVATGPDAAPSPAAETEAIVSLVRHEVHQLLDTLRSAERESIVLAYYGQMTYREVAASVGRPEGTVKTQIRTGLARLREVIELTGDDTGR